MITIMKMGSWCCTPSILLCLGSTGIAAVKENMSSEHVLGNQICFHFDGVVTISQSQISSSIISLSMISVPLSFSLLYHIPSQPQSRNQIWELSLANQYNYLHYPTSWLVQPIT